MDSKVRVLPWLFIILGAAWALTWLEARQMDKQYIQDNTLNTDVLAPRPVWGGYSNRDTKETFLREYEWLHNLLERTYPGHEFLIVPNELGITPQRWGNPIYLQWRSHTIYKRPIEPSRSA